MANPSMTPMYQQMGFEMEPGLFAHTAFLQRLRTGFGPNKQLILSGGIDGSSSVLLLYQYSYMFVSASKEPSGLLQLPGV